MTPLERRLVARIAASGPMPLPDWMAACLMDPEHGYYATRDPFGAAGDFTTAPEISQMFGELLGLCLAQAWLDQGAPAPFTLAEMGPGRGTLMADVLRATQGVPGFHAGAAVVLVEASPALRRLQADRLGTGPAGGIRWADGVDGLPDDRPLFLIANEFLDALPIERYRREGFGWTRRWVGVEGGVPVFVDRPDAAGPGARFAADAPGQVVEVCPALAPVAARLSATLRARGGAALVVDYGGWRSSGDTLQALRGHAFAPPLSTPGEADLTAHVDFEALALAAGPDLCTGMTAQGALLERLGIAARADRLAERLSGNALAAHRAAQRRLTHPQAMGALFKAMALHPPGTPPPPGFDPAPHWGAVP